MDTEFFPTKRHSQTENFAIPSGLKTGSDLTLSAGFKNRRNPMNKGVRAFKDDPALYRPRKTTLTNASKLGIKPSQGTKESHAQIFDKMVKEHSPSMSPAQRASAMRLSKDRWKQGSAYLGAASALGLAPSLSITINWQTLSAPSVSEARLVHSPVNAVTAKFIRRLSDWFRGRSLPSSYIWSAATGSDKGAHCHIAVHVPEGHLSAFLAWLSHVCDDPLDHLHSDQREAISNSKGWHVEFVFPPRAAYAVCYVCIQAMKHLPSVHDPRRRFGRSLRAS